MTEKLRIRDRLADAEGLTNKQHEAERTNFMAECVRIGRAAFLARVPSVDSSQFRDDNQPYDTLSMVSIYSEDGRTRIAYDMYREFPESDEDPEEVRRIIAQSNELYRRISRDGEEAKTRILEAEAAAGNVQDLGEMNDEQYDAWHKSSTSEQRKDEVWVQLYSIDSQHPYADLHRRRVFLLNPPA